MTAAECRARRQLYVNEIPYILPEMPRYRFDFLTASGDTFAVHEIDYADDHAAIVAGHEINGSPPIGACFKIWRDNRLIYHHNNEPRTPD